jgi:hypothetical protein
VVDAQRNALRMRHQDERAAVSAAETSDAADRAARVQRVLLGHAAMGVDVPQGDVTVRCIHVAFAVRDDDRHT